MQRIIESARKLGVPLIVTDPGGREPFVVLSLEQFEAMVDTGESGLKTVSNQRKPGRPSRKQSESEPESKPEPIEPYLDEVSEVLPPNPEISLDERFYLEPLDDEAAA